MHESIGDGAFHVAKKLWIAAEPAHQKPTEENTEQQSPAPAIPGMVPKCFSGRSILPIEQSSDLPARMNQWQHPCTKGAEIGFEFSCVNDSTGNVLWMHFPERARCGRELSF